MHDRRPVRVALFLCLVTVLGGCTSGVELPDVSLPELSVPELTFPDLPDVPDLTVPDLPDLSLPGETAGTATSAGERPAIDPAGTRLSTTAVPTTSAPGTAPSHSGTPGPETAGAAPEAQAGQDGVEDGGDGSGSLVWLILGIAVVLALLAALVVHQRSAARREWEARARTAYLEGRWIADQAALRDPGDPMVGERREAVLALVHELELDPPTRQARDAIRRVGAAVLDTGRTDGDAGAERTELLDALDQLGEHLGRGH